MILPSRIGRYEVEGLLGQGGMGAVYKARDPELDRFVAIKTVSPLLLAGEEHRREYLERFRREARAAGRLSHPNIVSVYDLATDNDTVYFVMEYVPGVSLETLLRENPILPLSQASAIVEQVASGLEEAHRQGIVHRDVKPANVFIDERGRVKVGDFGIARIEGSELTQAGVGLGTPGYAAPELLRGGTATARSDVFALGVLAYRLFTGKRPFQGALPETLAVDILEHEPAPPRSVRGEVPEHVSDAVMHALAKTPEERTPSAFAFLGELNVAATDRTPSGVAAPAPAPPVSPVVPVPAPAPESGTVATVRVREPKRRVFPWLAAVVFGVLAAFVAWRALNGQNPAGVEPDATRSVPEARASPRPRASPSAARPAVRSTERAARPAPAPRPADVTTPPFRDDTRASDILREAEKKLEEILGDERKKPEERPGEAGKKGRGKKKGKGGRG